MTTLDGFRVRGVLPLLLCFALVVTAGTASAATITIVNNDGAGEGFNDPAPRAPIGGNPGTTLGQQRLNVFQYAANIWGSMLPSTVVIQVRAAFNPMTCTATSATLGSTSSNTVHRDFAGAPYAGTWYVQSLANRLAATDLSTANPDMTITFNSTLDGGTCLGGSTWYYGYDNNEGANVDLLPVVLHEMSHGFGFATTTSGTSGNFNGGYPSIYDRYLYDEATGLHWYQETAAQRVASAISLTGLTWDGMWGLQRARLWLNHRPRMAINSPPGIAGVYSIGTAAFGPALTMAGVTGNVVLVQDTSTVTNPNDGCDPIVNAAALAGKIALVDRGICTFVIKAKAAQNAGAIAVLIANNTTGIQPPGGSDPTIVIPVVGISQANGNAIKANLATGVNVTLGLDPVYLAGMNNNWRPLMYAPNPYASGSSVSHWDVTMTPNTLMEPNINADLTSSVDITSALLQDIGWGIDPVVATTLALFTAEGRSDGILLRWQFSDPADVAALRVERAPAPGGPWYPIQTELSREELTTVALDPSAEPGTVYFYRLVVTGQDGKPVAQGLVTASRSQLYTGPAVLAAPRPNPTSQGATISFRIGKPEFVRLTITDPSGRRVRTLQQGMMPPGEYTRTWDGLTDHSAGVPAGVYFVTLGTSEGMKTQRVAVIR